MHSSKLLVRLPNWVGDVIMTLPAIDLLQSQNITPVLLGKPWIHDLLQDLKIPLHTWPKEPKDIIQRLKHLDEKNILLFPNSLSSAVYARLGQKKPIGYGANLRTCLLATHFTRPQLDYEAQIFYHLTYQYLKTITHSSLEYEHHIIPKLPISSSSIDSAKLLLKTHQISQNYIVLCPFAHGLNRQKQSKRWPHWQALCETLPAKSYIICPGPHETEEAYRQFPNAIILKNIPLNIYAAVCQLSTVVIANDSGPMHIAAAVGAHTIGLFGATDPKRAAPHNAQVLGAFNHWPKLTEVIEKIQFHHA
jgi:heptosyltransferase-2